VVLNQVVILNETQRRSLFYNSRQALPGMLVLDANAPVPRPAGLLRCRLLVAPGRQILRAETVRPVCFACQNQGRNNMAYENLNFDRQMKNHFSAPVPRELVHRRAISEVFVTGINRTGSTTYTLSAQWPRWHVFFGSVTHGFDSALVVETLRQLTVLIAHTGLHVPLGMQFLMPDMSISMTAGAVRDSSRPAEVTVEVHVSEIRAAGRGITAFRTKAIFLVNGQGIADGTAGARIVDPEAYNRIRSRRSVADGYRLVPPLSPAEVGHGSSWNVVLGESSETRHWPLRVDVSNPILFDHPLDHIPGVLLIEAVRQAVRVALQVPSLDFSAVEAQFVSIAEFSDEGEVVLESMASDGSAVVVLASIRSAGDVRMRAAAKFTARQGAAPALPRRHHWKSTRTEHMGLRDNPHA
jgi:hypothetical protein